MRTSPRNHRNHLFITALTTLLLVVVGCGDFEEVETPDSCQQQLEQTVSCETHVFLDVDEFEFLRQNGDPVILDARADKHQYTDGHIPGAHFANWGQHRDEGGILWDDDDKLEEAIQSMGVEADRSIFVYGEGDGSGGDSVAGNLFWTLEYLGHDDVYLLNGGLNAWLDANYGALATGETDVEPTDFEIERREQLHADFDQLKSAIDDEESVIIDTRRHEEWTGDNERDNPQGGHIPEAVHYHWEDVFRDGEDQGLLKPADELTDELLEAGIDPELQPLPYCQSGVRSGYFYAVLKWLDAYENPVNYDGSWWEWSREAEDEYIIVPEEEGDTE